MRGGGGGGGGEGGLIIIMVQQHHSKSRPLAGSKVPKSSRALSLVPRPHPLSREGSGTIFGA